MKLRLGKMTSRELANWFNISYNSYKNHIAKFLDQLDVYCEFEKIYGGIIIKEIFIEDYDKNLLQRDKELYLKEIKNCIESQSGLSSVAGMSRKYVQEGAYSNISTANKRLTKAGTTLFGVTKDLISCGEIGKREYIWAIKINNYNKYRLMTPEEEEIFNNLITTYYNSDPDKVKKVKLLERALRKKEITSDEYFEQIDMYQLDTFSECLYRFKEKTGKTIARCSRHELEEGTEFED